MTTPYQTDEFSQNLHESEKPDPRDPSGDEDIAWMTGTEAADSGGELPDGQPPADAPLLPGMTRVAIDWMELEGALENNSPRLNSFFNKRTGDVIRLFGGSEIVERRLQEVEADPDYIYIEPISSREQYKWMEDFIATLEEGPLKERLVTAVDGKGAFRRFKDALADAPEERERWFALRSEKLQYHMREWLKAKNITPLNTPPWAEGYQGRKFETVKRNRYSAELNKPLGTSLRRKAHELVDLLPSKDLAAVNAFLEFLCSPFHQRDHAE